MASQQSFSSVILQYLRMSIVWRAPNQLSQRIDVITATKSFSVMFTPEIRREEPSPSQSSFVTWIVSNSNEHVLVRIEQEPSLLQSPNRLKRWTSLFLWFSIAQYHPLRLDCTQAISETEKKLQFPNVIFILRSQSHRTSFGLTLNFVVFYLHFQQVLSTLPLSRAIFFTYIKH